MRVEQRHFRGQLREPGRRGKDGGAKPIGTPRGLGKIEFGVLELGVGGADFGGETELEQRDGIGQKRFRDRGLHPQVLQRLVLGELGVARLLAARVQHEAVRGRGGHLQGAGQRQRHRHVGVGPGKEAQVVERADLVALGVLRSQLTQRDAVAVAVALLKLRGRCHCESCEVGRKQTNKNRVRKKHTKTEAKRFTKESANSERN